MKSNELRIGNYVYLYNPESWEEYIDEVVKVEGIDLNISQKEKEIWKDSFGSLKLVCDKQEFNQFSEYAKHIPLTEEWLLKFGFELDENAIDDFNNIYYDYGDYAVFYEEGSFIFQIENMSLNNPKYVHQLQNLYFALTGEELTIKE